MSNEPDEQRDNGEKRLQRTLDRLLGNLDDDDRFIPGDRVMACDGVCGTVIAVVGALVTVRFDTSLQVTTVATKLTRAASKDL